MQVETFTYIKEKGWSVKQFPKLDSPNTLLLAFCAPEYLSNTEPLTELKKAFPNSKLTGYPTSGEINNYSASLKQRAHV